MENKKYFKYKIENLVNISKIVTVHNFVYPDGYAFEGESHDFWEMVYVKRGSVIICRGGAFEERFYRGDAIFHRPGEFHSIRPADRNTEVFIVSFDCKSEAMGFFSGLAMRITKENESAIDKIQREAAGTFELTGFTPELTRMSQKSSPLLGGAQMLKLLLEQLLISLMREGSRGVSFVKKQRSESLAAEMIGFLKDNLSEKISLDVLCRKFFYSKNHLLKVFKNQTGMTIAAYLNRERVELAKQLLREDELSHSDIAARCGFETPQYFNAVFKKISGVTPKNYAINSETKKTVL